MRKDFVFGLGGAVALAAMMAAAVPALGQQQSPVLDAAVESGELPALADRLPSDPLVITPVESVGTYGGTWRSALRGGGDNAWISRTVGYDGLVRYDREWKEIIPNLAASWEISEDAKTYTFKLRDGLKWSDGEPFTSADVAFAMEVFQTPSYAAGSFMKNPNNKVSIEIVDDTTFKYVFEKPNGILLDELASVNGINPVSLPEHYCGQFFPGTNEAASEEAKAAGFETWELWMEDRCAWGNETIRYANPEIPTLMAWMVEEPLTGSATRLTFVRNPYYWKVDTEGNQLPYIDKLDMRVSDSVEEITLMALNGEIDYQDRHIATTINQPLFFDGQEAGGYHLGANVSAHSNNMALQFNFNHVDPKRAELFQNKDFRIGISHALDRQEIVDVVFTGEGEPYQVAPRPESVYYDEEYAKQYTEFDPELAAQHFTAAGLVQGGDGMWTFADGTPLVLTIDIIAALRPEWVDIMELVQLQLAGAGIKIEINNIDRTLYYDKRPAGEYDAQVWTGDGGLDVVQEPRYYMAFSDESVWAFRWVQWWQGTNPEIAEEPADWAKQQMDLYDQLRAEGDATKREALMKQILVIGKENFPVIGINLPGPGYYIARNNLKNVPADMLFAYLFPTPAPYDPFQWYFAAE
ncbi:MAG: ABC transporter substrate-binding protein [Candidatus Devosia phytovorans]|uniref:ABC transporter substrate-binding protein n=1 Tax=Candidatus Devosia phytovorans TaxID=3121372 RepID=A0AAJ5VUC2_9HYPH|nr:ABC transporter substrate-binding protein [Devosia sp.]WEK05008.1 MAG: ABC transporter substrate-binding protein [Devosia sp.]